MKLLFGLLLAALLRAAELACVPECATDEICQNVTCQCNSTMYKNSTYLDIHPIVKCLSGKMVVSVGKCLTNTLHIDPQNTTLADANCTGASNITLLNGIFLYDITAIARTAYCGNVMKLNTTHVTYSNMLHIPPLKYASGVIAGNKVEFPFSCTYLLDIKTSLDTVLKPLASTIGLSTGGSGLASTTMAAYSNPSYTSPITSGQEDMSIGSTIYFGMTTEVGDADVFVLRVDTCYATPTQDPNSAIKVSLIENGCPANGDVSIQVVSNGESLQVRFSISVFIFKSTSSAYIYCSARLCVKASQQCTGCRPNNSSRSDNVGTPSSSIFGVGPLYFQDLNDSSSSSQTAVAWTVLGSSLLMLLSLRLM
ncbi:uromodulin-like [Lissotriton helveticus]